MGDCTLSLFGGSEGGYMFYMKPEQRRGHPDTALDLHQVFSGNHHGASTLFLCGGGGGVFYMRGGLFLLRCRSTLLI